jgi:hypothetical protein
MKNHASQALRVNWKDWRSWLWLFGIFTLIEAFDTFRLIVALSENGTAQQIQLALSPQFLARNLIEIYSVALIVPFLWSLAGRVHFQRIRWWAWIPSNLLLLAGAIIAHQYLFRILLWGSDQLVRGSAANGFLESIIGWYWVPTFSISVYFILLLGVYYGLDAYQRWRERELESAQLAEQLAQAKLQALQTQIQPHFLFNTLQAIAILIHREPIKAEQMLIKLGDLLRVVLDNEEKPLVSLQQELDFVRQYLEIHQVRFGDRLLVHWDVDSNAQRLDVPTLLLQPLVENAIEHGISKSKGPGEIFLSVQRNGKSMILKVTDNGGGEASITQNGRGLFNTQQRLKTLYGDKAQIDFGSSETGGTAVCIKIPISETQADS